MCSQFDRMRLQLFFIVLIVVWCFWQILPPVSADSFYPTGSFQENRFYAGILLSFQENDTGGVSVPLDIRRSGSERKDVTTVSFSQVFTRFGGVYQRGSQVGENVGLIPGDEVFVDLLWSNETEHTVAIKNIWWFLEQYESTDRLADVIAVSPGQYRNVAYYSYGLLRTKGGMSMQFPHQGNFLPGQGRLSIGSFRVRDPLQIVSRVDTCGEYTQYARVVLGIKNVGAMTERIQLPNNSTTQSISPGETKQVLMSFHAYEDVPEAMSLLVTSSTTRCLSVREQSHTQGDGDTFGFLLARDDVDSGNYQYTAPVSEITQIGEGGASCITRLPYQKVLEKPNCPLPSLYQAGITTDIDNTIKIMVENYGENEIVIPQFTLRYPRYIKEYIVLTDFPAGTSVIDSPEYSEITFKTSSKLAKGEREVFTFSMSIPVGIDLEEETADLRVLFKNKEIAMHQLQISDYEKSVYVEEEGRSCKGIIASVQLLKITVKGFDEKEIVGVVIETVKNLFQHNNYTVRIVNNYKAELMDLIASNTIKNNTAIVMVEVVENNPKECGERLGLADSMLTAQSGSSVKKAYTPQPIQTNTVSIEEVTGNAILGTQSYSSVLDESNDDYMPLLIAGSAVIISLVIFFLPRKRNRR